MNKKINETNEAMEKKIQKIIDEKNNEKIIEKENINKKVEEEIKKRLDEEVNKRIDNEVQKKLNEELKKLEYINLKNNNTILDKDSLEKYDFAKKISMDIPEEIKTEVVDANIEKLRKKNVLATEKSDINKIEEKSCTENCTIF